MAYVRTGRGVRTGRVNFVPGAVACAAVARRFPLSFAPLRFAASSEDAAGMESGKAEAASAQGRRLSQALSLQPAM